jgi:hypothetical protein
MTFSEKALLVLERPIKLVFRRHVDHLLSLRIRGKLVDATTKRPVEAAQITFLDTGLDSKRSKNPDRFAVRVGESGRDGSFDLTFEYLWGTEIVFLTIPRTMGRFTLRFECHGDVLSSVALDPDLLSKDNHTFVVDLGEIAVHRAMEKGGLDKSAPTS